MEKKDLLEAQTAGLSLSDSECSSLAGIGNGLYRRGTPQRKLGVTHREKPGHWSPFICDHQMEWVSMHR
jgi:hypothetical protein